MSRLKLLIIYSFLLTACTVPDAPSQPIKSPPLSLIPSETIALTANVSTIAGAGKFGYVDDLAKKAQFYHPNGVMVDSNGNVLVADRFNHVIRKIKLDGQVVTLAGNGQKGFLDGDPLNKARFNLPIALTMDSTDHLYVADTSNHVIRKITPSGEVSTFAGLGDSGFRDGKAQQGHFNWPAAIVVDQENNLFIADRLNHAIRKITPDAEVSTLAGSGVMGFSDGQGKTAQFNEPMGLTLAPDGSLYVADSLNHRIRKVSMSGEVTTIAGGEQGFMNGQGDQALFNRPAGIVADKQGNLFVVDRFNHRIRKITPEGDVSVVAGQGEIGFVDARGEEARFQYPLGIAIDDKGSLYIADHGNHAIRKIEFQKGQ